MCRIVTIDIETLPAPEPDDFAKMSGKRVDDYLKTSLSGDFGRILCIGYTDENEYTRPSSPTPDHRPPTPDH